MLEREPLLLVSKLSIPPWRPHWVPRPRLLSHPAPAHGARLLLCAAPAGFGKTTALIAWAEARRAAGAAVAWYTLDPADNDLPRFAAYLLAAIAQADPALPLAELQQWAAHDVDQLLVGLLNLLGASRRPTGIVLDDYHLIQSPPVHQALARLIDHLPATVQLAIGTRADPPLPLARLRVRGQLAELRAADLQFAPAEVAAFFAQRAGPPLSAHALALLADWTEGWAAGLQLAALALPAEPAGDTPVEQLVAGSRRHIFTFLADEVFAQQPPPTQAFLLATCVVDDLTPELCDALLRAEGSRLRAEDSEPQPSALSPQPSASILEQLEAAHLFLIRLDPARPWYRYHHLFRDFLRGRLDREQPGLRAQLHRRAAEWYAATGEVTTAVNHALACGDGTYAAELIVRGAGQQLTTRGEIATVLAWGDQFSPAQLTAMPVLSLILGRAAYLAQQAGAAAHFFTLAEQGLAGSTLGEAQRSDFRLRLMLLRAPAASLNGEISRAESWLAETAALLSPGNAELSATHASAVGVNRLLGGDLSGAYAAFAQMGAVARRASHSYFASDAVGLLALTDLVAGRLGAAERRCNELLAGFGPELPALPSLGLVLARLGAVAYHRGQLAQAEQLFLRGAQIGRRSLGRGDRQIWPWLVHVAAAQGDQARLHTLLAEDEGRQTDDGAAVLAGICMAARAEALLALGAVDEAARWVERCAQLPGEHIRDPEILASARVLLAQRRPAEALTSLERLVAQVEAGGRVGHLIEALVAQSQALTALLRPAEARAALRRARALAEPEGYVQIFAEVQDAGGGVYSALAQPQAPPTTAAAASPQPAARSPQPPPEPLTEREREVLGLIARGATNQQIAAALVITLGTAKTHLNHILGKLGARNRTEAVARARAMGLL